MAENESAVAESAVAESAVEFGIRYLANAYSQNGEDGIIAQLLQRLDIREGWVAEVGAWDGKHLSNTYRLVEKGGFRAVYVEGDPGKFLDLQKTAAEHPPGTIVAVNAMLSATEDTFGAILSQHSSEYALVSIDIDSFDYAVWENLALRPDIVVIEINSDELGSRKCTGPLDAPGTSFLAMLELGRSKKYTFVCHTGNMIFVRQDLFPKLGLRLPASPWLLFKTNWLARDQYGRFDAVLRESAVTYSA